ncbi:hypothetical protein AKO1_007780 [Acrasis kona]|uniref:SGNH hydrolase-type esterase domain-containing protein n=1 Tax=Acrasis kona TaxID=1008807 RepID=A0AAW2YQT6_9EUKA
MSIKRILCIGDSWTALGHNVLQNELRKHGDKFLVSAVPQSGSTAQMWASNPFALKQAIYNAPDAQIIWLSVGGNDITHKFMQGFTKETGMPVIERDIETILDVIIDTAPNAKIVHFGYDFPTFPPAMLQIFNQSSQSVNQVMIDFSAMIKKVSQKQKYINKFFTVEMTGTLQRAGNIPNVPNFTVGSPQEFMNDPIHPNQRGFQILMSRFWDQFLNAELSGVNVAKQETSKNVDELSEEELLQLALEMSKEQQ